MVLVRISFLLLALGCALMCAALIAPVSLKLRWSVGVPPRRLALGLTMLWGLAHLRSVRRAGRKRMHFLVAGRWVGRRRGRAAASPSPRLGRAADGAPEAPLSPGRGAGGEGRAWWCERDLIMRWLQRVPRLLDRLGRCLRCEPATVRVRFGLGDPAETGLVYGAFWALMGPVLSRLPFRELTVEGDWLDATFASSGRLHLWARPAVPLLAILVFLLGGPWLRTLRAARGAAKAKRDGRKGGRGEGDDTS